MNNKIPNTYNDTQLGIKINSHDTGLTEGVVHNYCNAVMWQYENK